MLKELGTEIHDMNLCTGDGDQNHPQEKEVQKGKVLVWGGLANSWVKK